MVPIQTFGPLKCRPITQFMHNNCAVSGNRNMNICIDADCSDDADPISQFESEILLSEADSELAENQDYYPLTADGDVEGDGGTRYCKYM